MRNSDSHLSDQELLLAMDGELPIQQAGEVQAHLASCWTCRSRMREIDGTITDFIQVSRTARPQLPSASGARALLKLRMTQLAAASRPALWHRFVPVDARRRGIALALTGVLAVLAGIFSLRFVPRVPVTAYRTTYLEVRSTPDPQLTPGATLPVTRNDLCAGDTVESTHLVPGTVARKVFAAYGIQAPEPRAYEVDYLITPALGGADNIRNFWPQPYRNTVWNAHIKDALEEYLRRLVCAGQLDLAMAQQEIARDWIAAYKKYFRTDKPLPEHVSFLKDRPWE